MKDMRERIKEWAVKELEEGGYSPNMESMEYYAPECWGDPTIQIKFHDPLKGLWFLFVYDLKGGHMELYPLGEEDDR